MYGQAPPPQQAWQQPPAPTQGQQSQFPPPASSTPGGIMNGNYDQVSNRRLYQQKLNRSTKIGRDVILCFNFRCNHQCRQ